MRTDRTAGPSRRQLDPTSTQATVAEANRANLRACQRIDNMPFSNIDTVRIAPPPATLWDFAKRFYEKRGANPSPRRGEPRVEAELEVLAVPVNEDAEPTAEPFKAITRDVSPNGVGILHTRSVSCTHLAVRFRLGKGDTIELLIKVLRCRPTGPFYHIGCRIVKKLSAPAADEAEAAEAAAEGS